MTGKEFKKAITLLRDCENRIDFIVKLYDLVDQDDPEEKAEAAAAKKPETAHSTPGQQPIKKYKPKICEICHRSFTPKNNRQTKCDSCKSETLTVEQDMKNTAAELAAMMRE